MARYFKDLLGNENPGICFPAAYMGKVASGLSKAGFQIHASDISPHWVDVLRKKGLDASRASIHEITKGYDAVVSFEPYCADSSVLSYLAMLKMLAWKIPYIEIVSDAFSVSSDGTKMNLLGKARIMERKDYPHTQEGMVRLGYDYGAQFRYHIIDEGDSYFCLHAILPRPNATRRARLDLEVLESEMQLPEILSLTRLAAIFKVSVERMAASILRLSIALNERLDIEFLCTDENPFEMSLFKRRLALNENPDILDTREFFRRMSIRNC